ncbi:hypothetical protein F441_12991 [Phytophthora nicotianae CJ01A1]|uniref:No apical meristem-associated C-terminal domain-containing protein n=1 Tax=Phytophthora nicotianae CJ01A1 TaxID=1317063 RepID=W2WPI9_PHYNI|nr:hypothetical protein F441_12991 [Phytophthora nicotianae CJ01A1]
MLLTKKNTPSETAATAGSDVSANISDGAAVIARAGAGELASTGVAASGGAIGHTSAGVATNERFTMSDHSLSVNTVQHCAAVFERALPSAPTAKPGQRVKSGKAKRKKFGRADDLMLLRQVNTDHPYKTSRGRLMDAWTAVATKLKTLEGFSKTEITGKSAQARFNVLIDRHREYDKASAAASGVSEEYDETIQLLDDLLLEVDEYTRAEEQRSAEQKEKLAAEEKTGKCIRDEAVARLQKRKVRSDGDQNGVTPPRKVTVIDLMREDNEKEREMRAEQWKQEQEMMRQQKQIGEDEEWWGSQ